ncbi:MAG: endonuclease domain-containing protein [Ruminococcaceae bacterium]|nr:endonuclease domain-containing protein [Oscillospiraceae bacterium]
MKEYNKSNVPLAKELRKNMTPWENKLWYQFLRSYPVRWNRQKVLGNYIVDFYCSKAKLIIELDGGHHFSDKSEKADALRTKELEATGLRLFRIPNSDIDKNFNGVCEFIDSLVKNSLPPTHLW